MPVETEITTQTKFAYEVLDRFGLPTLFTLLLFGALIWVLRIQQNNVVTMTKDNQIKIDMLTQIEKDDATIITNQHLILDKMVEIGNMQDKFIAEHRLLQQQQNTILNQLGAPHGNGR